MLRIFLIALLIVFAVRALARLIGGVAQGARGSGPAAGRAGAPGAVKMTKDPICGTFVVPGTALSLTAGGDTLWFCSERCRAEYASRA